ncbi:MAG: HD domain-containing phosphohydrolase [Pseudomonadales bacterium]
MLARKDFKRDSSFNVLVVDDEFSHRMLEREILQSSGYNVIDTESGFNVMQLLEENDFDAILLDQRMPGMKGDQVCRLIRHDKRYELLPIIMVTGCYDDTTLSDSLQAGASDFIRKPYSTVEFLSRVNSAVRQKRKTDDLDNAETLLFTLARMVEAKDEATGNHCSRLAYSASAFGRAIGLGADDLEVLRRGGVLHDIGKLAIPDRVLLKKGPLNDDEWKVMRQHTVIGAQLCSGLRSFERVVPIIRSHHERWEGGGYPDNLKGKEIPLLARVFQLVDIHDALTNPRPYKPAWESDKVINMFETEMDSGWRDPLLCKEFIKILKHSPEMLDLPADKKPDLSEEVFEEIRGTGVLAQPADALIK